MPRPSISPRPLCLRGPSANSSHSRTYRQFARNPNHSRTYAKTGGGGLGAPLSRFLIAGRRSLVATVSITYSVIYLTLLGAPTFPTSKRVPRPTVRGLTAMLPEPINGMVGKYRALPGLKGISTCTVWNSENASIATLTKQNAQGVAVG